MAGQQDEQQHRRLCCKQVLHVLQAVALGHRQLPMCMILWIILNLFFLAGGFDTAVNNYESLLTLARSQGAVGGQNRGACKKCGQIGHLTKQCYNNISLVEAPSQVQNGASALAPVLPPVAEGDEQSSDISFSSDSDSDSDMSTSSEDERKKRKKDKASKKRKERKDKHKRDKKKRKHKKEKRKEKKKRRAASSSSSD